MGDGFCFAVFFHQDLRSPDAQDLPGIGTEEGIAAPFLSALDALQEKDGRAVLQFHQGRDRGFRVRQDLAIDRDEVSLPGQSPEGLKIRIMHGSVSFPVINSKKKAVSIVTAFGCCKQKSRGVLRSPHGFDSLGCPSQQWINPSVLFNRHHQFVVANLAVISEIPRLFVLACPLAS